MSVREVIEALIIAFLLGLLVTFILLNIFLGCDSWSNPNCLTPKQFMEVVF